jgi:predicted nucleic-acid-binding protein
LKITADANLLVRAIVRDDARQARIACRELEKANAIVVAIPALCELVWVLARGYAIPASETAQTIRRLRNVVVNRAAAEAGLAMLDAGGDFADGAIAFEGQWGGAEVFASFDRKAVKLLAAKGVPARVLPSLTSPPSPPGNPRARPIPPTTRHRAPRPCRRLPRPPAPEWPPTRPSRTW